MNKFGKYFIFLGIILVIFSFSLLIYNNLKDYQAGKSSKEVLKIIEHDNKKINENIITNVNNLTNKEEKVININNNNYIGTIEIPSLNLKLPIMSDFTYDKLNISPCRYFGSIETKDLVICGHAYRTHFKYLVNLEQGDLVIITDFYNNTYIYEVLEIEILKPTDIEEMLSGEFDLTLYTCTSDSKNRITVRCNLISE